MTLKIKGSHEKPMEVEVCPDWDHPAHRFFGADLGGVGSLVLILAACRVGSPAPPWAYIVVPCLILTIFIFCKMIGRAISWERKHGSQ
jgi:hypothetical protein